MTENGREQSFIRALLDLSFSQHVTPRIVHGAFVLSIAVAAAILLGGIFAGASMIGAAGDAGVPGSSAAHLDADPNTSRNGWLLIVASPVVATAVVVFSRVATELVEVVFSIAEALRHGRL